MNEIARLLDRERELEAELAAVRAQRAQLQGDGAPLPAAGRVRPLRDLVLDLLAEARFPMNSLLLAAVARPLLGREIASTRFGTLSADEQKAYDSRRPRSVHLAHCLTHDQGQAMKRFWARSDWPLHERVIGPMSGRVLFLKGALWAIGLARDATDAIDPERLRYVAADQARDAGLDVRRGEFPFDDWLGAIERQLDRHSPADEAFRRQAAAILEARFGERELLFGARVPLVSLPGSTPSWRSAAE